MFECSSCDENFASPENLQEHIEKEHVQTDALSLLKNACSTLWMYIKWNDCDKQFANELDLKTHFSEADYTEAYDSTDITHVDSSITKRKRKIDDTENYENIIQLTTDTEILLIEDDESLFPPIISKSKRKRLVEKPTNNPIQISQNLETSISCKICNITFTRKDNYKET